MNIKKRNQEQIKMALGEVNRYYFGLHYNRAPKEGHEGEAELLAYFIEFGAEIYAKEHGEGEDV
jgi:hypothetical protein